MLRRYVNIELRLVRSKIRWTDRQGAALIEQPLPERGGRWVWKAKINEIGALPTMPDKQQHSFLNSGHKRTRPGFRRIRAQWPAVARSGRATRIFKSVPKRQVIRNFSAPQATKGAARKPAANIPAPITGLAAEAMLRGTAVKLATAARSGGVTTGMTKALRAGASIDDRSKRTIRSPNASPTKRANAAAIRHRLAGMWVNTIVLTKPIRLARGGAASCDAAEHRPAQKK